MAPSPASRTSAATLAAVLDAVLSVPDLALQRRQNMASAVRTVARFLGRPLDAIPADPRLLGHRLDEIAPEAMGITRARWANVRSLLQAALALTRPMLPGRQLQPLSPGWQVLYDRLPGRHRQMRLSRLLRYFSARQIEPRMVTEAHGEAFINTLREETLLKNPEATWRDIVWAWNRCRVEVPGWPEVTFAFASRRKTFSLPWTSFPPSLEADVDNYLNRLSGCDLSEDVPFRPVRPATRHLRERQLRTFASALVLRGRDPEKIRRLSDLVSLDACNAVIGLATETHPKRLFSEHRSDEKPQLVVAADDVAQVDYVVQRILEHRESGIELKQQAVLFRTSHHSALLEIELARRNIPFVKFGGLKFLEAAHVKDVLCILRWAENPQDTVAGFRVLQLLPGMGPTTARRALDHLADRAFALAALKEFRAPAAAASNWAGLCDLSAKLHDRATPWIGQLTLVKRWYEPLLEIVYDDARLRAADIDKLEQIAAGYQTRERFLSELTLDPPEATGAHAQAPFLDEDYLILSTIHSAKGQEWSAVFVLNVVDGCIPSDMAAGSAEEIEEERRLLYVSMTRAKRHLHLIHPIRFYRSQQQRMGDAHVFAPLSRFLPDCVLDRFERRQRPKSATQGLAPLSQAHRIDVAARMRDMWR